MTTQKFMWSYPLRCLIRLSVQSKSTIKLWQKTRQSIKIIIQYYVQAKEGFFPHLAPPEGGGGSKCRDHI
jgi:hypothetical protein